MLTIKNYEYEYIKKQLDVRFKRINSIDNEMCAVIMFEENWYKEEDIFDFVNEDGKYTDGYLFEVSNCGEDIISRFRGTSLIPTLYDMEKNIVTVLTTYHPQVPQVQLSDTFKNTMKIDKKVVPLHLYLYFYQEVFKQLPSMLNQYTAYQLIGRIVHKAIRDDIPDVTISCAGKESTIYYNKYKRKEYLNFNNKEVYELTGDIKLVLRLNSNFLSSKPVYSSPVLPYEEHVTGRVVYNQTIDGFVITIRLFRIKYNQVSMEELNLPSKFISDFNEGKKELGLKLVVGETMSGKNTTIMSYLQTIVEGDTDKIVSVEYPAEAKLKGVEQLVSYNTDDLRHNMESLIHQNPDFVYVTEINQFTANGVLKLCNTGKRVISTLHANSPYETLLRLQDLIPEVSINKLLLLVSEIVTQKLIFDEDRDILVPVVTYTPLYKFRKELIEMEEHKLYSYINDTITTTY